MEFCGETFVVDDVDDSQLSERVNVVTNLSVAIAATCGMFLTLTNEMRFVIVLS